MKSKNLFYLIQILFVFIVQDSFASHAMGGEIRYVCNGGNQYTIYLSIYRDCSGIFLNDSQTIVITNSCGYTSPASMTVNRVGNPQVYSNFCDPGLITCFGGTAFGFQRHDFSGTVTLPGGCSDWTFSNTVINRNASITTTANGGNDSMFVYSMINNTSAICDTAPEFSGGGVGLFYLGNPNCFSQSAYDSEGDSVAFQLTTPRTGPSPADTVHYLSGYTYTQPVSSITPITFDSITGNLCFTGYQAENSIFAIIASEFRNGILIGQIERDIQLRMLQDPVVNSIPTLSGIDGSSVFNIAACPGVPVEFFVASYDSNSTEDLFIYWDHSIPSATWTYDQWAISNSDTAHFSWTPALSDVSGTPHCFTITSHDNHCGNTADQSQQFCITVYPLNDPFCINPGITEHESTINFQIYPNPAHDELNFEGDERNTASTILSVFNSTGRLVYSKVEPFSESINVSQWSKGLYNIVLKDCCQVSTRRIIIQ